MNIHEAARKAKEINGFIVSAKFPHSAIELTDTPDCCKVHGACQTETRSPKSRWQPHAEDLVAEDWEVIRSIDELPLGKNTLS